MPKPKKIARKKCGHGSWGDVRDKQRVSDAMHAGKLKKKILKQQQQQDTFFSFINI